MCDDVRESMPIQQGHYAIVRHAARTNKNDAVAHVQECASALLPLLLPVEAQRVNNNRTKKKTPKEVNFVCLDNVLILICLGSMCDY